MYEVISPAKYSHHVAKILHKGSAQKDKAARIRYMIDNPPQTKDQNSHDFLIWPEEIILENRQFAGYIMPKARGIELEELCQANSNFPAAYNKFDLQTEEGRLFRIKLCQNIAVAVSSLHRNQDYVLGDLKPINIIVQENGLVSLIDLDSIQISGGKGILFPASVATPEYCPPEDLQGKPLEHSWDNFGLAVIFYRLLTGIHPFTGSLNPPHQNIVTYDQLIKGGFYPHGPKKSSFYRIPAPHQNIQNYPPAVANALHKSLGYGVLNPNHRITSFAWYSLLDAKPVFIRNFKADKTLVFPGQEVKLSWKVEGAQTVEIWPDIGTVSGDDHILRIDKPSKYEIVARNIFGEIRQSLALSVIELSVPKAVFIPAADINIQTNMSNIALSVPGNIFNNAMAPNISPPDFTTPSGTENILEELSENYKWVDSFLKDAQYNVTAEELLKYKLFDLLKSLRAFSKKLLKKP